MKKRDLFFILLGLLLWITAQYFTLRFFSFEDFLKKQVLSLVEYLLGFFVLFVSLTGITIFSVKKMAKLDAFLKILNRIKKEIDSIFQKRVQSAFRFPLPENYQIGTKNLKNTYRVLWASSGFFVYFFLNASFNMFSTVGLFSIKFILPVLFSIISGYFFMWFSFVTILAFASHIIETIIILVGSDIIQMIRSKTLKLFVHVYPATRDIFKFFTMVVNMYILLFSLVGVPILILYFGGLIYFEGNFSEAPEFYRSYLSTRFVVVYVINPIVIGLLISASYGLLIQFLRIVIRPNEVVSSFLKRANKLISNFDENTDVGKRYDAINFLDYCIDFLPQSAGYYVLPIGMRLEFRSSRTRLYRSVYDKLSRKMEYLKKQLEKLAFDVRYAKKSEHFNTISTELKKLSDIMANERYDSLKGVKYEKWSLSKRLSVFFDTSKPLGVIGMPILLVLIEILRRVLITE